MERLSAALSVAGHARAAGGLALPPVVLADITSLLKEHKRRVQEMQGLKHINHHYYYQQQVPDCFSICRTSRASRPVWRPLKWTIVIAVQRRWNTPRLESSAAAVQMIRKFFLSRQQMKFSNRAQFLQRNCRPDVWGCCKESWHWSVCKQLWICFETDATLGVLTLPLIFFFAPKWGGF